jgi:hypothetical protein
MSDPAPVARTVSSLREISVQVVDAEEGGDDDGDEAAA